MKKIKTIILISLLLSSSIMVIVNNEIDVEAAGGGEGENGENSMGLNFSYLWEVTWKLANVTHDTTVYETGSIPKGRYFGSEGDKWTANYLEGELNELAPTLEDVEKIQIIRDTGKDRDKWRYNYVVDVDDFELTINGDDYIYSFMPTVPLNATYVWPTGSRNLLPHPKEDRWKINYTNSFTNNKIVPANLTKPLGIFSQHFNIECDDITEYTITIGNATYVNDSLPPDQEGRVFLLEEKEGVNDTLENITSNASAVILIKENTDGPPFEADTSKCNVSMITRVDKNDVDNSPIISLLQNDTIVIAENILKDGFLNFSYNFSCTDGCWCEENDFFYVTPHGEYNASYDFWVKEVNESDPDLKQLLDKLDNNYMRIVRYNCFQYILHRKHPSLGKYCHGIIAYDIDVFGGSTHLMWPPLRQWPGWSDVGSKQESHTTYLVWPLLQTFFVNHTVGQSLVDIHDDEDASISGHITQSAGNVEAYNVIGNITIPNSPNDYVTIVSNRYDSLWSEAPGDSGAGAGIVLGIAKYFHDYEIKPKYNLTFLFTTGEERGYRGAWHFNHSHNESKFNINRFIGTDQLGFSQAGSYFNPVLSGGLETKKIMGAIANITGYEDRTGYGFKAKTESDFNGLDPYPFQKRSEECDTILIHKDADNPVWYGHHRSGEWFQEGDSMNHTDRKDLEVSFELAWNVTKYYCVDPDCWLENVTFESFDSPNDGDTLNDSIRANFTVDTVLPHEYAIIEILYDIIGNQEGNDIFYTNVNFTVNSTGLNNSVVFSIPDNVSQGNYSIELRLYNSTGRVNKLAGISGTHHNATSSSSVYHLYHPFGYANKGENFKVTDDNITGSVFTVNEYGYADYISAYVYQPTQVPPCSSKCMIYRKNDSKLIGTTEERSFGTAWGGDWIIYDFEGDKPGLKKNEEYVLVNWGNGTHLYYDTFTESTGRYNETVYLGNPPDPISFTGENRLYSIYCSYTPDNVTPEISAVGCNPELVGYSESVTITAEVTDLSGINKTEVRIYKPDDDPGGSGSSYTMSNTGGDTYEYVFNDTWQNGQYNYSIWAEDNNGNSNNSSGYSFNLSAQATVSVCTVQDEYGNNTWVNITDPPSNPPQVGYELLDNGEVLHIWNRLDSYYFNTSSGIQLTNHYNEYWSHNVLMLGYYNNDEWNLIYRTDELSGFNKNITSDEDFVNATLWKDLSYEGYDFRLSIRYHLGAFDNELTVIPYIKNIGDEDIPCVLGFAWEIKDIQIDMTPENDYIEIDGATYYLNQTLEETYTNLDDACFYIREDHAGDSSESLYLRWDEDLNYKVQVKSRDGQYNAPVTLGIKIGTLDVGQEKQTSLFWYDLSEVIYYFNSYDNNIIWTTSPSNMVDGSISNYASTNVDDDEELCDGNSCSTSDLGAIGIVELRSYGYYSGYQRDTFLRPVFGGTTDGYFYPQRTNATPSWSEWSYITNDPYGPGLQSWTWSDVQNLDCKVIAESGMFPFTLYCSKVEIRVRYTPNNDPVISNPVPADESTGISIAPVLNITVSDLDGDSMNITWLSNSSGSWVAFGTNNSVGNGTYHQTMSNASVNGQWWYWKLNVTDGSTYVESSVFSFYTGYESKIKNIGSTNISGYVFMQVQYYDEEIEEWVVVTDCQNDTTPRIIKAGEQFGLDTVFNGKVYTLDLIGSHGTGSYRVYACFRDPDGDVLVCDDETLMEDSYEFTVTDS